MGGAAERVQHQPYLANVQQKTQLAALVQVSLARSRSATDPNRIRIAVCLKSIHWPMCQGPICSVSASAFSLAASRPTPKTPPTAGTVITHSSKFVICLVLYTVRPSAHGRPILM